MGSIFCIGQSAYDITIPLDGAICENQKYRVTQKEECGGGPAFNAAYLCAMWGEKVELISRIGNFVTPNFTRSGSEQTNAFLNPRFVTSVAISRIAPAP